MSTLSNITDVPVSVVMSQYQAATIIKRRIQTYSARKVYQRNIVEYRQFLWDQQVELERQAAAEEEEERLQLAQHEEDERAYALVREHELANYELQLAAEAAAVQEIVAEEKVELTHSPTQLTHLTTYSLTHLTTHSLTHSLRKKLNLMSPKKYPSNYPSKQKSLKSEEESKPRPD